MIEADSPIATFSHAGQLMECLLGKLCCHEGEQGDATPFRGASIQQISNELDKNGFDRLGGETLYNGMTGTMMKGRIFVGPTYYQRLKHMVCDASSIFLTAHLFVFCFL